MEKQTDSIFSHIPTLFVCCLWTASCKQKDLIACSGVYYEFQSLGGRLRISFIPLWFWSYYDSLPEFFFVLHNVMNSIFNDSFTYVFFFSDFNIGSVMNALSPTSFLAFVLFVSILSINNIFHIKKWCQQNWSSDSLARTTHTALNMGNVDKLDWQIIVISVLLLSLWLILL